MGKKRKGAAIAMALPVAAKLAQKVAGKVRRKRKSRWQLLLERANKTLKR